MSSWDESRFAECWGEYENRVRDRVLQAAITLVYPFLERRGYRFVSGNGTFVVCDADDEALPDNKHELERLAKSAPDDPAERTRDEALALDEEYIAILSILWEDVPGMNQPLGNFMDDYTPFSRRGGSGHLSKTDLINIAESMMVSDVGPEWLTDPSRKKGQALLDYFESTYGDSWWVVTSKLKSRRGGS